MADLGEWDFGALVMDGNGLDGSRDISADEFLGYQGTGALPNWDVSAVQVPQSVNPGAQTWGDVARRGISTLIDSVHQQVIPSRAYPVMGSSPYQVRQGVVSPVAPSYASGYVASDQVFKTLLMVGGLWWAMR